MNKIKKCPFECGGNLSETLEKRKHVTKKGVFEGNWIIYKCDKCKEGFTTTESDERSLKQGKFKKL